MTSPRRSPPEAPPAPCCVWAPPRSAHRDVHVVVVVLRHRAAVGHEPPALAGSRDAPDVLAPDHERHVELGRVCAQVGRDLVARRPAGCRRPSRHHEVDGVAGPVVSRSGSISPERRDLRPAGTHRGKDACGVRGESRNGRARRGRRGRGRAAEGRGPGGGGGCTPGRRPWGRAPGELARSAVGWRRSSSRWRQRGWPTPLDRSRPMGATAGRAPMGAVGAALLAGRNARPLRRRGESGGGGRPGADEAERERSDGERSRAGRGLAVVVSHGAPFVRSRDVATTGAPPAIATSIDANRDRRSSPAHGHHSQVVRSL